MRSWLFLCLLTAAAFGCGDEVRRIPAHPVDSGGGGGAATTTSTGTTLPEPDLSLQSLRAPDEHSVLLRYSKTPPDAALDASVYAIDAPQGSLSILAVELQPDGRGVLLSTSKQKLGITYTLAIASGQPELDRLGDDFLAADTATFWAADFGSPAFDDYQLVAERREVGTHGVLYVEQGMGVAGTSEASAFFDSQIYPIETSLFTLPPDMDGNERIVLLGLDGASHYGGYFSPINTLTDEDALQQWGRHSNEMEMVYINVAPGFFDAEVVLAHEFQHLLYHERHGLSSEFPYHNEGLAECAVNAVNGFHPWALDYLVLDPQSQIAAGLSLIDWQYGNYDQYVLSYVFWSWIAGQLGGLSGYAELFHTSGHPSSIETFLQSELGIDFSTAQLRTLIASWIQAPSGLSGFNGLLTWPGAPPSWSGGSLALAPFAGTWIAPSSPSVDYPGTQGPNIVYAGVNGAGEVDLQAPFDVSGGVLVTLNKRFDLGDFTPEPIGLMPSAPQLSEVKARDPSWRHPPPLHPSRFDELARWRSRTAP